MTDGARTLGGSVMRDARRGLPVLGGAVLVALGIFWMLDAIMYPWAVSLSSPTLPGFWSVETDTAAGSRRWMEIELRADDAGRHGNQKVLGAIARVCDSQGMRQYDGSSRPHDWRGTRFDISLGATDQRSEGLARFRLSAEWNREDVIRADLLFEAGGQQSISVDRSGTITRAVDVLPAMALTLRRMTSDSPTFRCIVE